MEIEKRKLGNTGLMVSFLGFGALEIGRDWGIGEDRSKPSDEEACVVLNGVLDVGINLIDTARAYHRSEERIGNSIAHRRRTASICGPQNLPQLALQFLGMNPAVSSVLAGSKRLSHVMENIGALQKGMDPELVHEAMRLLGRKA